MAILAQSTAYTRSFKMIDSADHFSKKTGLTCAVNLSKAGGSFGAAGGTVTEVANGWYKVALNTTDTNTIGDLAYYITATGADDTDFCDQVGPPPVNVIQLLGTAWLTPGTAGTPDVNAKLLGGTAQTGRDIGLSVLLAAGQKVDVDTIKTNPVVNAGTVTFPTTATLASTTNITAGTITTTTNLTNLPSIPSNWITAAGIADAAIDRATFAADTGLQNIRAGTAQAGAATTITLDAGASATNSFYNNDIVYLTGGTGAGQARFVTAYVGATKVATVATWATNPDNTSTFAILPFDAVAGATAPTVAQIATGVWQDTTAGDFTAANSVGKSVMNGVALGTGLTVNSLTNLPSIPANWLTAAGINASALNGKGDWMVSYTQPTGFLAATFPSGTIANTTNITAGTMTTVTNLTNAATAGDLTATMAATVKTQVVAALNTDTYAEPAQGAPAATTTLVGKIGFLYKAWRNKTTQDSTTYSLFNDDAATVDHKSTVSDNGTTFTRGEVATGP